MTSTIGIILDSTEIAIKNQNMPKEMIRRWGAGILDFGFWIGDWGAGTWNRGLGIGDFGFWILDWGLGILDL
jgi:hypothetical protein